ncbi:hypothetical protein NL108_009942 [Boleophthalmus pectinirostris]|uniref:uncharacterized protein LOC110165406 n=1 Tax=Boleophthalmus pectinirostris TaxID=150288 RepID=UPI00242E7CD3|nr:uncharacterized protein LOC110165406 [Boleophthalmus pectinirostris]KAJ0050947.1 hypothetical protein NL108_009942 [Boleophthalmus pectinirostris]
MACISLTKLGFLVILGFIISLPEFFTIDRVRSVSLLCGDEDSRGQTGGQWRSSTCDEQWEPMRAAADQRNVTQAHKSCFVCQADVSRVWFDHNSSSPADGVSFEVSFNLQWNNTATEYITLVGRYNHSSQYFHLYNEEEKEKNYEYSGGFLYCPGLANTDSANHSCCLLCLSLQITAREGLPWKRSTKDEWGSVLQGVWLSLLCVVLLLIVTTVSQQIIKRRRRPSENAKIYRFNYTVKGHQLKDEKPQEVNTARALKLGRISEYSWSALSSIAEEDSQDETDAPLNDYRDESSNENTHHSNSSSIRRTDHTATIDKPS